MNKSLKAISTVLSLMLFVRGVDYVTGDSVAASVKVSEGAEMPLYWGIACIVAAVAAAVSMLANKPAWLQNTALLGFAIYAMFAVQAFDSRMLPIPWPPEDTRLIADHIGHSVLWLLVAVTVWWRNGIRIRRNEILGRENSG